MNMYKYKEGLDQQTTNLTVKFVLSVVQMATTVYESEVCVGEPRCSTNWGNWQLNQMLVNNERGKPKHPEKNCNQMCGRVQKFHPR